MADDVLVEKVFNFICGSGGFVELSLLVKDSSPLKSKKTKLEATNWLVNYARGRFVLVKDYNDEVTGVRIDLKKKICQHYLERGSCRRAQGKCKFWHICKSYIEGDCDGNCRRSHNFFDSDNEEKTKDLKLEKHPNGTLRSIVACSLPQVCQLYLKRNCESDKCPYLHVCANVVRELPCTCALSHDLTDFHNKKILKQYDLVPHQSMKTAFVCSSILVIKEQKIFVEGKCTSDDATVETATAASVNKLTDSAADTPDNTKTMAGEETIPGKRGTKDTQSNATCVQPIRAESNLQLGKSLQETKESGTKDSQVSLKPKKSSSDIGTDANKNEAKCDSQAKKKQKQKRIPKYTKSSATPQKAFSDTKTELTETKCDSLSGSTHQETKKSGAKDAQTSIRPQEDSSNIAVDVKQSKTEWKIQHEAKNQEAFVNNLACSSTVSARAPCGKSPEFLNIKEEEGQSDSSLEENKPTSDDFKASNHDKKNSKHSVSSGKGQPCDQIPASKPSSKVIESDAKCIQAKAKSQKKVMVDPLAAKDNSSTTNDTSSNSLSANGIKTAAYDISSALPVLPAGDIGNDFVKKWVMGGDERSSDLKESESLENSQIEAKPVGRQQKLSISSSCSSVPDPQKCTPSKKAVFDCILKEYNGTVAFPVISKREDLFPDGCGDIAAWFRTRKESFLLNESKDGTVLEVSTFCRRAKVCFNQDNCSRKECSYLHVCREYIAGYCRFGSRCQRNHSFKYDEERRFISKLKLNGLTEEELRTVAQLSMPRVCIHYNEGHCSKGDSCGEIHICKDMIRKKCDDQMMCGLKHEDALLTPNSTAILHNYGLKIRDSNVHPVLRALLVCEKKRAASLTSFSKGTVSTETSLTASKNATDCRKEIDRDGSVPLTQAAASKPDTTGGAISTVTTLAVPIGATGGRKENNQDVSIPVKGAGNSEPFEQRALQSFHKVCDRFASERKVLESFCKENNPFKATTVSISEPSERKVFECLCKEYNCSVSVTVIAKRTDLFPSGFKEVDSWFRQRKGSFLITENHEGVVTQVNAFSAKARLCFSYNSTHYGTCKRESCSYLHVCRDYITDSCANGATCPRNHQFLNEKDKAVLSKISLDQFTDEQLRRLVLSSTPLICVEYNDGICDRGGDCYRIHMCSDHLKKCYREGRGCGLDHESALTAAHTKEVLQRYHMEHLKPEVAKRIILLYDDLAKNKEADHVHHEKPNAPICSDFLLGKCKKGIKCSGHHCSLPYHWQYRVEQDDVWKSFSETDNEKLEKLYCNVMLEECSASGFQLFFESDGFLLFDEEYDVNFLLDNKLMVVRKDFEVCAEIRRLSTEPFASNSGNPVATAWTWYWKDENGIWLEYSVDHLERDLQRHIEDTFQSGTNCFKFKISEQDYALYFFPTSDMRQENLRYGTKRKVRRRPAEFQSAADIRELRRSHKVPFCKRKRAKNVASATGGSYWSPMPPNKQYTRVVLSIGTTEYKEVEKLFKRTIQKSVVIRSIERVQNPFEWDKYQRKKENMLAVKTSGGKLNSSNEKRLFHGTSPEAVEAICKQNFDWRLHGKNATVYGEGSYFALNASYSDAYAREDANSSKYIFLAKVLVGSYTKGHSSYRRPPQKNPSNPASDLYDSCVDDKFNPTIFVVFETNQSYPEYVIEYSHDSGWISIPSRSRGFQQTASASNTSSVPYHSTTSSSHSGISHSYSSSTSTSSGTHYRGTSGLSAAQSRGYSSATSYSSSSFTSPSTTAQRRSTHGSYSGYTPPSAKPKQSSSKDSKCLVM